MVVVVEKDAFRLILNKTTIDRGCCGKVCRIKGIVFVDKSRFEERAFEFNAGGNKVGAERFDFVNVDRKGQYVAGFEVLHVDSQCQTIF